MRIVLALVFVLLTSTAFPVVVGSSTMLVHEGDPDVPALTEPVAVVQALDAERWSFTGGFRAVDVVVPSVQWDRVVLSVTIEQEGDPWDRLFALSIDGAEVLRGTTPRTHFTIERDVTRYASLLQPGDTVPIAGYLDSWVPGTAMLMWTELRFYDDASSALVESAADAVYPITRFSRLCSGGSTSTLLALPSAAPASAQLELYVSGHGSEEFWYLDSVDARDFVLRLDGEEVARATALPFLYALLGFSGSNGAQNPTTLLVHEVMWWTAQKLLDRAGIHYGTGEVPHYRVDLPAEVVGQLTGERTFTVELEPFQNSSGCQWVTSANLVLGG